VSCRIGQKDPTILYYIQEALGMGNVYARQQKGSTFYSLVIYRKSDMSRFIRLIYPHVRGPQKRKKLREAHRILKAK